MKNAKFISYSQQTYASMIVKLSLYLKWYYPIMPVNFYLKTKGFFPHDFTLIASVVGESVIGHGIGGIVIPAKWRVSLRPDAGVSDDGLVCHHPILRPVKSVMAKRSTYVDVTYYREFLHIGYPPPHRLK
jgi:hypothetical protein